MLRISQILVIFISLFSSVYANNINDKNKPYSGQSRLKAELNNNQSRVNYIMDYSRNLSLKNLKRTVKGVVYVERWKDLKGYKGCYQISDFARLKSLERNVKGRGNGIVKKPERIRLQNTLNGYAMITLYKNNVTKSYTIHRLVALHFYC